MKTKERGRIERVSVGEPGRWTVYLMMDFGGSAQGFGGMSLPTIEERWRFLRAVGGVLDVGPEWVVDDWPASTELLFDSLAKRLIGTECYSSRHPPHNNAPIAGIMSLDGSRKLTINGFWREHYNGVGPDALSQRSTQLHGRAKQAKRDTARFRGDAAQLKDRWVAW